MSDLIKKGSKGDPVRALQQKLSTLGFDVAVDGDFGGGTDAAVRELQTLFGYTVDGLVGPGTLQLIDAQIGYGWHRKSPDAVAKAQAAQAGGTKQASVEKQAIAHKQATTK